MESTAGTLFSWLNFSFGIHRADFSFHILRSVKNPWTRLKVLGGFVGCIKNPPKTWKNRAKTGARWGRKPVVKQGPISLHLLGVNKNLVKPSYFGPGTHLVETGFPQSKLDSLPMSISCFVDSRNFKNTHKAKP